MNEKVKEDKGMKALEDEGKAMMDQIQKDVKQMKLDEI